VSGQSCPSAPVSLSWTVCPPRGAESCPSPQVDCHTDCQNAPTPSNHSSSNVHEGNSSPGKWIDWSNVKTLKIGSQHFGSDDIGRAVYTVVTVGLPQELRLYLMSQTSNRSICGGHLRGSRRSVQESPTTSCSSFRKIDLLRQSRPSCRVKDRSALRVRLRQGGLSTNSQRSPTASSL